MDLKVKPALYKLQKICFSIGLGGCTEDKIFKVKQHLENIFTNFFEVPIKCTITHARKANAFFKLRTGTKVGLKLTLRNKKFMDKFVELIKKLKLAKQFKQHRNNLNFGVHTHRLLKLERYNPTAPSYGFNFNLVFSKVSTRPVNRRVSSIKQKYHVPLEVKKNLLGLI